MLHERHIGYTGMMEKYEFPTDKGLIGLVKFSNTVPSECLWTVYIYIYVYIYMYIYIIYMCVCVFICTYIYIYIRIYIYVCVCVYKLYTHTKDGVASLYHMARLHLDCVKWYTTLGSPYRALSRIGVLLVLYLAL